MNQKYKEYKYLSISLNGAFMKISLLDKIKKGPKLTLGLDIGSHSIKLVELAKEKTSEEESCYTIRKVGRIILPEDTVVDGSIVVQDTLKDILITLIKNLKPKYRYASTSIAGYSVIVKKIGVPFIEEKEIEENLIIEAENYVPFEIEDVYVDFHVIGTSSDEKEKLHSEIFLVAAKKEVVDEYANVLQEVGLVPAVVDVDAFALGNAFEVSYGDPDEAVVLVDIGASKTNLNIVYHGTSLFTRDMAIGGNQLTEAISDELNISNKDAEILKIQGTKDQDVFNKVQNICKDIIQMWADEIKKAIDFYKKGNEDKEAYPQHVIISGGCALMNDLDKFLKKELNIDVQQFNPWKTIKLDEHINPDYLNSIAPQMVIATGLALRTVDS